MSASVPSARVRVVVHGAVQGVFFRDTCRRTAGRRHVAGWVRNRPDGSVEAAFEGGHDQVRALVDWCRSGPPAARVDKVEEFPEPPEGLTGFEIRR
ncbi:acylphosphatase [Actinopolymorpha rutila]|uniref:Acylphosphatase n=1 Tax=Actinopolymorpha rutila TaxID=446787 RepID=A0A852ZEP2_9ACTN|nr:acylphosphatase [Actinopolymorpha rutila]NYH90182.1 acylphosphatase [Actinopolymorpha rutila]